MRIAMVLLVLLFGCSNESPLTHDFQSNEAIGVVTFLNHKDTDFQKLDDDVKLDKRAAQNLINRRNGVDGEFGTADDEPFIDLEDVDSVKYVGKKALELLADYARENGWLPCGEQLFVVEDVAFSSIQEHGTLRVVNRLSQETLDNDVELDGRAASAIVAARPIENLRQLGQVSYVGKTALIRIRDYADAHAPAEFGVISDLDKTVIPKYNLNTEPLPNYPIAGMTLLYNTLETQGEGNAGDFYYVTARPDFLMDGVEEWLDSHGLPEGPVEPGTPGWDDSQAEKVSDMSRIFDANPLQDFILFGDSNHKDPDVCQDMLALYGNQVAACLIHIVKDISSERLEGLYPYNNPGEAIGHGAQLGILAPQDAQAVFEQFETELSERYNDSLTSSERSTIVDMLGSPGCLSPLAR